jgi:hypothetical protein
MTRVALLGITLVTSTLGGYCWAITNDGRFTILGEGTYLVRQLVAATQKRTLAE